MTSNEQEENREPEGSTGSGSTDFNETASSYFAHLKNLLLRPDEFFTDTYHGQKLFGLIHMIALVVFIILVGFVQRAMIGSTDFGDLLGGIKYGLAFAVPLAILLFVFPWYAKQQGQTLTLDFLIEKLGAALALSALMVLVAIPLKLLDITLYSWFRSMGLNLIYIAVFMTAYWYVAPRQLVVATLSAVAFYFAYRLIALIL